MLAALALGGGSATGQDGGERILPRSYYWIVLSRDDRGFDAMQAEGQSVSVMGSIRETYLFGVMHADDPTVGYESRRVPQPE